MPFNFGSFAGGLAEGINKGTELKLRADEAKLKSKMLEHQLKTMEFEHGEKQRKAQEQAQQQVELGRYVDMLSGGMPGQALAPLEPGQEGPTPAPDFQVPNRPASKEELFGQSLKAVPREHQYHLLQESMKQANPTRGMATLAYPTMQEALATKNTPEFKQAYPHGARLTQTSRGFAWTGVDPVNAADNVYHSVLAQTGDRQKALDARNEVLYGSSAMTGAGAVGGRAATTLGESVAPPPAISGRSALPDSPFPPASQVRPAPSQLGPVSPSIREMSVGDLLATGQTGQPPQPTRPGQSPALRAKTAEEAAKNAGRPLEASDRTAIGAMQSTVRVAQQLKQNFTPEQLNQYVGFLKFPANRIAQIVKNDPKFAEFQTLVNMVKGTAFSEGGKQLTPFEAGITFGHIPTATEFSVADFVSKLNNTIKETQLRIDDRTRMASQPKGEISQQPPGQQAPTTSAGKTLRFNPKTGKIE